MFSIKTYLLFDMSLPVAGPLHSLCRPRTFHVHVLHAARTKRSRGLFAQSIRMDSLTPHTNGSVHKGVRKVVVTGANGYVAGEIVHQLLQKGYDVHGTVRDPGNPAKTAHLHALATALPGTLQLHPADLLQDGSFDDVIRDATYVFHAASPVLVASEDPEKEVIGPAVAGTLNVLASCAQSRNTVKRVVTTGSLSAMHSLTSETPPLRGSRYTEEDWNDDSTIENGQFYPLSKVLAERAAWDYAKKHHLDLVVINPAFVLGPALSATATAAVVQTFAALLSNMESMFSSPDLQLPSCDVRDVARAHILAAEIPTASGRYIVSQPHVLRTVDVVRELRERFPGIVVPDGINVPLTINIDSSKVSRELGLTLMSERESVCDMAVSLIRLQAAKPVFAETTSETSGA